MNKTRYSATEFGRNKPMNFRPSGTLRNSRNVIYTELPRDILQYVPVAVTSTFSFS